MKGHNLDWKKTKQKEHPPTTPPPLSKEKEVDENEPVIVEHASQCTATSFC